MKLDLQRFANDDIAVYLPQAGASVVIINWDSGIMNVVDSKGNTYVNGSTDNSPSSSFFIAKDETVTFTLTLKEGYELNSVVANSTNATISDITSNTFKYVNSGMTDITLTITTKQSGGSSMKSVDLTTLAGWNELADGTHNITIVAKGTGYSDSEESDSVQVNKSSGETWVLNETLTDNVMNYAGTYNINFKSNNNDYTYIILSSAKGTTNVQYNNEEVYAGYLDGWVSNNYRTITFDTAPTGALLTWLQANGTKQ